MGMQRHYECASCGYSATVTGGRDGGFQIELETYECQDCETLADLVVGSRERQEELKLADRNEESEYPHRYEPECQSCGGDDLVPWTVNRKNPDATGPCPRCAGELEPEGHVMWD